MGEQGNDESEKNTSSRRNPLLRSEMGLSVVDVSIYIITDVVGAGLLSLPHAVDSIGSPYLGFFLFVALIGMTAATGILLGKSWMLLNSVENGDVDRHIQYPYVYLGEKSFGNFGRNFVRIALAFARFGKGVVYLLLMAETLQSLFSMVKVDISFCVWMVIVIVPIIVLILAGRPKDLSFRIISIGGIACSVLVSVVLTALISINSDIADTQNTNVTSYTAVFKSIAIIVFNTGGHAAFPTFQVDMHERDMSKFTLSVVFAYLVILMLYLPVVVSSYVVLGSTAARNILVSTQLKDKTNSLVIVKICVILHFMFGFTVALNPFYQDMEAIFNVPQDRYTWKRGLVRVLITSVVLLTGEAIPHFGAVMILFGTFTYILLVYICPPLIYLKLSRTLGMEEDQQSLLHLNQIAAIGKLGKILCYLTSVIGIGMMIVSASASIHDIKDSRMFEQPCFVNSNVYQYDIWNAQT